VKGRGASRGFAIVDHENDGLKGMFTIVGGKFTTYRLMAEKMADKVCAKLGNTAACRTADEPLVPEVSEEAKRLIEATRQAFFEGIKFAKVGYRINDISAAVQDYVESHGFSVVRDFVGHGIGRGMHEAPEVPNYRPERGHPNPRLVKGMTICVEPMVCAGDWHVEILKDGWTVVSADHSLTAHYENTILITDGEPEILTMADDI
jgi:methionine aminopeptidase type I